MTKPLTQFELTVQKLAAAPSRAGLLGLVPSYLTQTATGEKTANALDQIFGQAGKDGFSGLQKVRLTAAGAALGAAAIGLGSLAFGKMKDGLLGNQDAEKAQHVELGKLQAQNQFKAHSLAMLTTAHADVLKKIMHDEVIGKADKDLMHSAYGTMKRFAPNLAADENAAKSFLREHATYGVGPSYAALKNLADAEQAVARAGGVI